MTIRTHIASAVAACFLVSSIASAQSGRRSAMDDADMKELASYTLTMDGLNKMDRVNKAVVANMQKDPQYAERIKLSQELATLKKKDEPSDADDKRIEQIEARIEQIDSATKTPDKGIAQSLNDVERRINAMPPVAAALKQEGVSAREYAKFTLATMQAGFALMAKQMSEKSGKPFQPPAGVNPANITFVEQHQAELKKMDSTMAQFNAGK